MYKISLVQWRIFQLQSTIISEYATTEPAQSTTEIPTTTILPTTSTAATTTTTSSGAPDFVNGRRLPFSTGYTYISIIWNFALKERNIDTLVLLYREQKSFEEQIEASC